MDTIVRERVRDIYYAVENRYNAVKSIKYDSSSPLLATVQSHHTFFSPIVIELQDGTYKHGRVVQNIVLDEFAVEFQEDSLDPEHWFFQNTEE